jgi:hypothetical protein
MSYTHFHDGEIIVYEDDCPVCETEKETEDG